MTLNPDKKKVNLTNVYDALNEIIDIQTEIVDDLADVLENIDTLESMCMDPEVVMSDIESLARETWYMLNDVIGALRTSVEVSE